MDTSRILTATLAALLLTAAPAHARYADERPVTTNQVLERIIAAAYKDSGEPACGTPRILTASSLTDEDGHASGRADPEACVIWLETRVLRTLWQATAFRRYFAVWTCALIAHEVRHLHGEALRRWDPVTGAWIDTHPERGLMARDLHGTGRAWRTTDAPASCQAAFPPPMRRQMVRRGGQSFDSR